MRLALDTCVVRSWQASDVTSLAVHANNRQIWENLRDRFPHPYTKTHGQDFVRRVLASQTQTSFAIDVGGDAVGGIGFMLRDDVERVSAEIGYWLGEAWWGRGICTEALRAMTHYAIEHHGLTRVFAVPYARNTASQRVLEKAGYVLEGRMRRSAVKDGVIIDQLLYAFLAPDATPPGV
jgi:RimJ/RimL family protein N-acetyltransferase